MTTTSRTRSLRALAGLGIALCAGAAHAAVESGSVAADAPLAISGDRQSPRVVAAAEEALVAFDAWEAAPNWVNAERFEGELVATAEVTAVEVGVEPQRMVAAWVAADTEHRVALLTGVSLLGTDYRSNGESPSEGFDCSGFTSWSWSRAGVELPRSSGDQISAAADRDPQTAMAGDLVQYPGHVMMYLGVDNTVVHSSNEENDVELWALREDRSYSFGDPTE